MFSLSFIIFALVSAVLIGTGEFVRRKFNVPVYLTRKSLHFAGGFLAFLAPLYLSQAEILLATIPCALALFFVRGTRALTSIHGVGRMTFGDVCFPLGIAFSALLFLPHEVRAFQFGVLVMGFSDGLAGLIGERFGKNYISFFGNRKSIEGASVFFICSAILTLLFLPEIGFGIVAIPLVLTLAEFYSTHGIDNLVLPVLGAYLLQAMG